MAWAIKVAAPAANPVVAAMLILPSYGVVFFAVAFALRIPEASRALGRLAGPRR